MFEVTFGATMLAALLACGVTTFGIHLISRHGSWARNHSVHFIAFAAGLLITVTLLHIIPKASAKSGSAPAFVLLGFLALYSLNRLLHLYLRWDENTAATMGLIPMLGIGLHSFIDGWIYSVLFSVDIATGVVGAAGMVLHELPEGIVVYVALQRGRYQGKRAWVYAFLAAGATTPLGAAIAYPFASRVSGAVLGGMLALSAGALLYVSASHMLPQVEEQEQPRSVLFLGAGVLVGVLLVSMAR